MVKEQEHEGGYAHFVVHERPVSVWGTGLIEKNRRFLRNLDPAFFSYQARVHGATLRETSGDPLDTRTVHASLALRLAFGQALEAFLSTVGAMLQAPHCAYGWLTSYRNEELRGFTAAVQSGAPKRAYWKAPCRTWEDVASLVLSPIKSQDSALFDRSVRSFSDTWRRFSEEFLNEDASREYNSLKHGFRIAPSPFSVEMKGPDGVLLTSEAPLAHSFPHLRKKPAPRRNDYDISHTSVVLDPVQLAHSLELLALSQKNVVAFLLGQFDREGGEATVSVPLEQDAFEVRVDEAVPVRRFTFNETFAPSDEGDYLTAEEVLGMYQLQTGMAAGPQEGRE
jgi:hypothetical protein